MTCVALLFGGNPGQTEVHLLLLATAALISSSLLFTRAFRLRDVRATISAPRRVAVGDDITFRVQLVSDSDRVYRRLRIEAPRLPREATLCEAPGDIDLLDARGQASTGAKARFRARGSYELEPFRAALLLPLALAQGPAAATPSARVVVVPRIARVTRMAMAGQRRQHAGATAQAARSGDSSELVGVRPYRPGDPIRQLHARSWARHGAPMVREFHEEHITRWGVVVDTDAGAGPSRVEAALSLSAGVVARLCRTDAEVDVLWAGDRLARLPFGRGNGCLDHALDRLATVVASRGFSGARVLADLSPYLERISCIVLVCVAWDAERAALVSALARRGVTTQVAVVADRASRTPHATFVPIDAITAGQEIALC